MTEQVVKLEKNESIAIITLNRPKVLNALSREVQFTLNDYISEIEIDDSINCVIVTGAGEKAFSAGGDIHEMDKLSQMEHPPQDHPTSRWYSWNLMNFKKPLIGAINGLAFGGGALMASTFDIRIGTNNTSFKFLAATYGRLNSSWSLPAQIGWPKAKELLFTGRQVMADEALDIGLLNHLVEKDKLMEKTMDLAEQIAKGDARMIQGIKKLMIQNTGSTIRDQYNNEMRAVNSWLKPITVQESFKTFLDKKGRKND
tara:strand:+ start:5290 stop:6060 length:771 start_codon:yes stop_codon:yes gene_type:complete